MNTWSFPGLLRIIQTTTQRGVDLYTSLFLMIKQYHLDLYYFICSTHINYNGEKNITDFPWNRRKKIHFSWERSPYKWSTQVRKNFLPEPFTTMLCTPKNAFPQSIGQPFLRCEGSQMKHYVLPWIRNFSSYLTVQSIIGNDSRGVQEPSCSSQESWTMVNNACLWLVFDVLLL